MNFNWFKKIAIPTGETKTITAYQSWVVRWYSVPFDDRHLTRPVEQMEIFPSKEDAQEYAKSLINAFKLTRCTDYVVEVKENETRLATLVK